MQRLVAPHVAASAGLKMYDFLLNTALDQWTDVSQPLAGGTVEHVCISNDFGSVGTP